jgi:hypothetical protein
MANLGWLLVHAELEAFARLPPITKATPRVHYRKSRGPSASLWIDLKAVNGWAEGKKPRTCTATENRLASLPWASQRVALVPLVQVMDRGICSIFCRLDGYRVDTSVLDTSV